MAVFNVCLVIYITLIALVLVGGIGSVMNRLNKLQEINKITIEVLNSQLETAKLEAEKINILKNETDLLMKDVIACKFILNELYSQKPAKKTRKNKETKSEEKVSKDLPNGGAHGE